MGKATLILALVVTFFTATLIQNSQVVSRETGEEEWKRVADVESRALALDAQRLVLAAWAESGGKSTSAPFSRMSLGGGDVEVSRYTLDGTTLDFTVRAMVNGSVHDIRSRYQWNNFSMNPLQIKAAKLQMDIDPAADLQMESITFDDEGLSNLKEILVDELKLASSLSALNMGSNIIESSINQSLQNAGMNMTVDMIDDARREILEQEDGVHYPGQADQAVANFMLANPGSVVNIENVSNFVGDFNGNNGQQVVNVGTDITLNKDVSGSGILVVEGNFVVPQGVNFDWDGLVIVRPPQSNTNPKLHLQGDVSITGGLVAIQESMPNTGHMDITTFRDWSGNWTNAPGTEHIWRYWKWCHNHRHDYSGSFGTSVPFLAPNPPGSVNGRKADWWLQFKDTIGRLRTNDVFLEIMNPHKHGGGVIVMEMDGEERVTSNAAVGFPEGIASGANSYRTEVFDINDLEHYEVVINRLPSLRKAWDSKEKYPGCSKYYGGKSGPACVGERHDRMEALTFRLYEQYAGFNRRVFEVSLYWHRRTDEEEKFEEEMDDLMDELKSNDYGLDIQIGNAVSLNGDGSTLASMNIFGGAPAGLSHIGTWHQHWSPDDENNPSSKKTY